MEELTLRIGKKKWTERSKRKRNDNVVRVDAQKEVKYEITRKKN